VTREFSSRAGTSLQASADFLMSQELPAIELLKTACHLLPEPYIVVEIVLYELLHVFVSPPIDIRSDAVELRLQFRGKVHFHDLRVGKLESSVKRRPRPIYWLRNEDSNF
jgi:hypothetical protein